MLVYDVKRGPRSWWIMALVAVMVLTYERRGCFYDPETGAVLSVALTR